MKANQVRNTISDSAKTILSLASQADAIVKISGLIVKSLKKGGKILAAGNGGSAAEAMHLTEELIGRFRNNRVPLPAVALSSDATAITCIGNDFGYETVFSRQVEALARPGDVVVLFSTSGNSGNLVTALAAARKKKASTICLLGRDGGRMAGKADLELIVQSRATEHIQEAHQVILHLILEAVEEAWS